MIEDDRWQPNLWAANAWWRRRSDARSNQAQNEFDNEDGYGQRDCDEGRRKGEMKTDTEEVIHFLLFIEDRREESIHQCSR
jgi:hypothetical protein